MGPEEGSHNGDEPPKKRRRGPHACATCRQRKVKCDGNQPCANCKSADIDCLYGTEPITKGKSDAILETVLRLEDRLSYLTAQLASHPGLSPLPAESSTGTVFSPETVTTERPHSSVTGARQLVHDSRHRRNESLDNAILSARHTSTTESVLAWPFFDVFPGLRTQYQQIFIIEQQRRKYPSSKPAQPPPSLPPHEVHSAIEAFRHTVNFSYPTVTIHQLADIEQRVLDRQTDDSIETSLALLVMALGCAAQVVNGLAGSDSNLQEHSRSQRIQVMAHTYFELYLSGLGGVHLDVSTTATQCLFFTALFFAYLQRPLQAYSYVCMTATKCRTLLSYTSADTGVDTECLRRIFWSCFSLESDYIAELAALPQTGVSDMESSVPYPAHYQTAEDEIEREQSSLYFLACVSMRRLLNRVHDLLYAPDTGVAFDDARFPHVVTELDHQLEEWRNCLPPSFEFSIDTSSATSQHGGFLRQRYLTCRAVIYRPYLNQVLSRTSTGESLTSQMIDKSEVCLTMCLLHILDLRAFSQTVLVDTWICSLSMASTMLLLLAASTIPALKQRLHPSVLDAGRHLTSLIETWMHAHGDAISPSVRQSLRMIGEIDALLQAEYGQAKPTLNERRQSLR
ncbi:hypothetical protein Slin15195_G079430 [Septoria linicola]|uniref:Zn(2)-C6 fungal-type domain-containing protein n=1 Tax=Septoria linicola TaxID=215465 RepID=A0A9Q9ATT4_9PEZI|nr:hypothetical protein Slin14017_G040630 [Septoria linicola]USW54624.1 hypothetical protein Slin15195_G079430 [Septoria linicola]